MLIRTLWKEWDDDSLELLFALDEGTYDENWQAWVDGCEAARKKYGIQPEDTREALIDVPWGLIRSLFEAPTIKADGVEPVAVPADKE